MALIKKALRLSVHGLVDFILRSGHIDSRIYNKTSMTTGSQMHKAYQDRQDEDYQSEFFLSHTYQIDDYAVTIEGFADGIKIRDEQLVIDEVKTTIAELEGYASSNERWHFMQAALYAHMYASDQGYDDILIRLIYIHQIDNQTLIKTYQETVASLNEQIEDVIRQYLAFYSLIERRMIQRDASIAHLKFPFPQFRSGQREMAKYIYGTLKKGGSLFVEAPTGIGKTISALYPSIISFNKLLKGKIFYLTAKNSGHEAAFNAINLLNEHGAKISHITITAKEKICPNREISCNPDDCPLAKNYYDKLLATLRLMLEDEPYFNRDLILKYAQQFQMCPFELQLDVSLFCDVIIGDYNYVFDPITYLQRFFDVNAKEHFLLIDEAHNLLERSRDMYSATIKKSSFDKMKLSMKKVSAPPFKKTITALNKLFKKLDDQKQSYQQLISLDHDIINRLDNYLIQSYQLMRLQPLVVTPTLKDFNKEVHRFLKIFEYYDNRFAFYKEKDEHQNFTFKLLCLDPSQLVNNATKAVSGAIFFSATLSPLPFFVQMLGGTVQDPILKLPSPFPSANFKLLIAPKLTTRYRQRGQTGAELALYIELATSGKVGNYFVFFPSYKYLNDVYAKIKNKDEVIYHLQTPDMRLSDQQAFLDNFTINPSQTNVAFVVLGGAFSEGIDLVSDRLIGAIIVGVGLPQLSFERELIKQYFDQIGFNGYAFSYEYPGMNRIMQAVGRVIRSEADRGIGLLIDDRYLTSEYRAMFKAEWDHYEVVLDVDDLSNQVTTFWLTAKA